MLILLGLLIITFGVVFARRLGDRLARRLDVRAGHARRVMPTLPLEQFDVGPDWRRALRRVEAAMIPVLEAEPTGVEAGPLAARLNEPLDLVTAVLERLREEVPCRLRVTLSGRLLHDFEPATLRELATARRETRPWLVLVYLLGLFSNLGAAWPVMIILFVASSTLREVLNGGASAVSVGVSGIIALVMLVVGTLVSGYAMHWALSPGRGGPKLGPAPLTEAPVERFAVGASWWALFSSDDDERRRRRRWSSSSSSSNSNNSRGDGAAQAIIIVVLIAIIAAALSVIVIWARGIWRAIAARRFELLETPTLWVREQEEVDLFERFLPTNDLVGRISRALRRAVSRRRPMDEDLGPRVLVRAARRGGQVSALEIALAEGLDLAEAVEIGTRLCTALDGRIHAVDGEVVFRFPKRVLKVMRGGKDPDLWAEFLTFNQSGPSLRRKPEQDINSLPVNLVGLRAGHLEGASRLAAGAWMMAATGFALCLMDLPTEWNRYTLDIPAAMSTVGLGWRVGVVALLCAFAIATTALAAAARYAATTEAALGARRDARRAAFQEIIEICHDTDQASVSLGDQARRLAEEFAWAWPGVDREVFEKEMIGVAADLDLEPTGRDGRWHIAPLRARIARAKAIEPVPMLDVELEDDPVIYDTRVELDRITALI